MESAGNDCHGLILVRRIISPGTGSLHHKHTRPIDKYVTIIALVLLCNQPAQTMPNQVTIPTPFSVILFYFLTNWEKFYKNYF